MFKLLYTLCLACAAMAVQAQETLLVFGDSLSAGYGIAPDQSWPALLNRRLAAQGYPYTVVNASISGETSGGGAVRLDAALDRFKPAIVVIELGANDGLRGLNLAQLRANLEAMIRSSRERQARVLLVGMLLPPNYGEEYTRGFAAVYRELARAHKVALLPFLFAGIAGERSAFQADGLHPTAAAQPLLLDNVWHALQPLLRKK